MKIELEKQEFGWLVRCGDLWEDSLCLDEALGCVASLMFTGHAPYLKNDFDHAIWDSKYGFHPPLITEKAESTV
jgi:hypothetical protein